jgi:Nucleotide modification associated domain 1
MSERRYDVSDGVAEIEGFYYSDIQRQGRDDNSNTPIDPKFVSDMWRIFDGAGNILLSKHHDYGPKNISQSPGGPLNGLRVRMWDKMARINNLMDNGKNPEHESLKDSFLDLLNYSAIALMVLDGTWPKE